MTYTKHFRVGIARGGKRKWWVSIYDVDRDEIYDDSEVFTSLKKAVIRMREVALYLSDTPTQTRH